MRLFFALWPPAETAAALARWAKGLEGRAIPAEKIHLTLAFLGGVAPDRAANRSAMADPAALDFFIDYARTQRDYVLTQPV